MQKFAFKSPVNAWLDEGAQRVGVQARKRRVGVGNRHLIRMHF